MRTRVLIVTNLFANPWDASRATFNQQQFERLAQTLDVSVLVPVSWLSVLRRPLAYPNVRTVGCAKSRQAAVDESIVQSPNSVVGPVSDE